MQLPEFVHMTFFPACVFVLNVKQLNRCDSSYFIFEIVMERYIYLRNTQNQLKITNYVRKKSFSEFYLVYNGVCLKLLGSCL